MSATSPAPDQFPEEHSLGDLYDYVLPPRSSPSRSKQRRSRAKVRTPWRPRVTDDWPERVPVTSAEVDIIEAHFAEFFEELFGRKT